MVTKTGYVITIKAQVNGKPYEKEIKSFSNKEPHEFLAQIMAGQTTINVSGLQTTKEEVVFSISDEDFLKNATFKVKKSKKETK